MADGSITFSTALDNSQLEKQLKEAQAQVEKLKKEIEQREGERNFISDALNAANEAITATEAKIEELQKRMVELSNAEATGALDPAAAQGRMQAVAEELTQQNAKYRDQLKTGEQIAQMWNKNEGAIKDLNTQLETAKGKARTIGAEYAKSYSAASANFGNGLNAMNTRFDAFMGKITKRVKKLFVFSFIFGALSSLKKYIMSAVKENEQFIASTNTLKATMAGIAAPIIQLLIPALTTVVRVVTLVLTTLARLVDSIFHTNFLQSIESTKAAIAAQQQATKATDKQTQATKRLAKAKKEATRWLAAFDELNVMEADKQDEGSDGDEAMPGTQLDDALPDGQEQPWVGFDTTKLSDALAEIMVIVGAALLAVGAVLAFSGINIPLGITLMAIGALMIYTAVTEQWDALPAELQAAITGALVITGIVLLVVGAVLAFANPATMPIGIGMMAAGAAMLWAAVALNWGSMTGEMQTVVSVLMGILGAALLVIGAVLAFSGGGTPLGIGLMLVGAATLAAAVTLNWGKLPDDVKQAITLIDTVVSTAFLVLGAILTFASPATTALGVGLLLVGAAGLATAAALNWDEMPDRVKGDIIEITAMLSVAFLMLGAILALSGVALPLGLALMAAGAIGLVSTVVVSWEQLPNDIKHEIQEILTIVGGALLVLGVILCLTGVAIPLGVALILAGVTSLVAAAAIDWDFMQNKIKDIWEGIVSWFNTDVAPIFTDAWWADKFKSIANGLISALNNGLYGAQSFINDLAGGVSDILNFFGVSGWSFSISMPQIPYLAQGAVIPPNRQFMAVLGDQTSGNNLEAPESLIRQIVREESGGGEVAALLMQILSAIEAGKVMQCDSYAIAKVVNDRNRVNNRLVGVV